MNTLVMESYFRLKAFTIYCTIGFFIAFIIIVFLRVIINIISLNRKEHLLKRNGYIRFLYSVPSVGDGATYAWKKKNKPYIFERELNHISYRKLKEKINN